VNQSEAAGLHAERMVHRRGSEECRQVRRAIGERDRQEQLGLPGPVARHSSWGSCNNRGTTGQQNDAMPREMLGGGGNGVVVWF